MSARLVLLWLMVGVPLAWGVWRTALSALRLLQ